MKNKDRLRRHGKLFDELVEEIERSPADVKNDLELHKRLTLSTLERYETKAKCVLERHPVSHRSKTSSPLRPTSSVTSHARIVNDWYQSEAQRRREENMSPVQIDATRMLQMNDVLQFAIVTNALTYNNVSGKEKQVGLASLAVGPQTTKPQLLGAYFIKWAMRVGYLAARLEAETAIDKADKDRVSEATKKRAGRVKTRRDRLMAIAKPKRTQKGHALSNNEWRTIFDDMRRKYPEYDDTTNQNFYKDAHACGLK